MYTIFCTDLSSQPKQLKDNGISITLHIGKDSALTLQGYCLLLEDATFTIATGNGAMLRIN